MAGVRAKRVISVGASQLMSALALLCLLLVGCQPEDAGTEGDSTVSGQGLVVSDAYFRPPVPGRYMTAAYATIRNVGSEPVEFANITAESVGLVELHNHIVDDEGVMKMREVERYTLAAGQSLVMKSGGYHLMLYKVEDEVRAASELNFTLTTASGDSIGFVAKAL